MTLFAILTLIYLLVVAVAYRRRVRGGTQLFIIVTLLVSMLAMFPPALLFLHTRPDVFTISAFGASIILPGLMWFAAFAAACLSGSAKQ